LTVDVSEKKKPLKVAIFNQFLQENGGIYSIFDEKYYQKIHLANYVMGIDWR